MEKVLEYLKQKRKEFVGYEDQFIDEAIALDKVIVTLKEAMKPKTCEGCVYEEKDDGVLNVECAFCLRNSNDNFKPKDKQ